MEDAEFNDEQDDDDELETYEITESAYSNPDKVGCSSFELLRLVGKGKHCKRVHWGAARRCGARRDASPPSIAMERCRGRLPPAFPVASTCTGLHGGPSLGELWRGEPPGLRRGAAGRVRPCSTFGLIVRPCFRVFFAATITHPCPPARPPASRRRFAFPLPDLVHRAYSVRPAPPLPCCPPGIALPRPSNGAPSTSARNVPLRRSSSVRLPRQVPLARFSRCARRTRARFSR